MFSFGQNASSDSSVQNKRGLVNLFASELTSMFIESKEKQASEYCCFANLGVDLKKIDICIGDPKADVENEVLKAEQHVQVWVIKIYLL